MALQLQQIRYYSDDSSNNYPKESKDSNISNTQANYKSGNFFADYMPIRKLGIQTMPGVQFSLNDSWGLVTVGATGIFELDLDDIAQIDSMCFTQNSMNTIANSNGGYLIIDIIYGNED